MLLFASATAIGLREVLSIKEANDAARARRIAALRCRPVLVADSDPFALGVTPSEIADRYRTASDRPPYVKRDIDERLDGFLRTSPFVAVVGPSKAGKSRTAFEALGRVYPDRLLIAPELPGFQREGMAEAVSGYIGDSAGGIVIWLDDLQEFLRTKSVATQDINAWRASYPTVVVIATIRDGELAALRETASLGTDVQRIVDQAKIIPLDSHLSTQELETAKSAYPEEDFRDGLGVHLVAGQQLIERFVTAREAQPLGFAIAAAAIDRRRAGVLSPATKTELLPLVPVYLKQVRPRSGLAPDEANAALDWAVETVIQDIGLLSLARGFDGDFGYEPFEYMTAYRDGDVADGLGKAKIPEATWATLIEQTSGWELHSLGWSAMTRGEPLIAEAAFERLSADSDPHIAAHGIVDLANVRWDLGDLTSAREGYEAAAATSFPCIEPSACYHVALLIDPTTEDAEPWYRRAIADPDSTIYPKALVNLGLLLRGKTNIKSRADGHSRGFFSSDRSNLTAEDYALENEAQEFFEAAMRSTDQEAVSNGGNALGVLLKDQGKLDEAESALRRASEAGSAYAAIALASLFADRGDLAEGRGQLCSVAKRDLDERERAYLNSTSAHMAIDEEDRGRAIRELHDVIEEGVVAYVDSARMALADLLLEDDASVEEAHILLQQVVDSGGIHSDSAQRAIAELHRPKDE